MLALAVTGATAQPPTLPAGRHVVDRADRYSPEVELALERSLSDHHRRGGLRVVLVSERAVGGDRDFLESAGGDDASGGRWVVLADTGLAMEWAAGPALAGRLDPALMRFVGDELIAPRGRAGSDREAGLVQRVEAAVAVIEAAASGRTPPAYLAWRLLEAPPDAAGMNLGVAVALRYLVVVLLFAPWLVIFAVAGGPLLARIGGSPLRVSLTGLALAVGLAGAALALALGVGPGRLGALFPYAVASALAFLLATPLHLLLAHRLAAQASLRLPRVALAYLFFPLAVVVAAAALRRVGSRRGRDPWLSFFWSRVE